MAYRIPEYSVRLVRERMINTEVKKADGSKAVGEFLSAYLAEADRETFGVVMLDTQMGIRGITTISVGTLDCTLIHPREVFKPAILASAFAIMLFHNHPSGDVHPSSADREVTRDLKAAGETLGIEVMDHFIVGFDGQYTSFREAGLM